jgi:predicted nucleic acid-binding protein
VRLVLDTSVVVAALIARGSCADLLEHCARHHIIVSSEVVLDGLVEVFIRKFRQRDKDARAARTLYGKLCPCDSGATRSTGEPRSGR